jgi:energy-coupling factor transport system permease protein
MKSLALASLDPRTKIMMLVCLSTMAMLTDNIIFLCSILGFTCLILFFGGVKVATALGQAKTILTVIVSLFIIQSIFTRKGDPLLVLGGFTLITIGGVLLACVLGLRLFILVFSALIMLTSEARDYLLALAQLKIPYEIVFMVMAAIHFIPILREEALNIFYAVQLRGTELKKTTLRQKAKLYLRICLPILVSALNRTKTMAMAMEARGFCAYPQRTYMRKLVLKGRDKAIIVFLPIVSLILIIKINF